MKKMKLWILGIASLSMLVSGCNGAAPTATETTTNTEEGLTDKEVIDIVSGWNPSIFYEKDPTFDPTFDEMTPVPESERSRLSSTLLDFHRGDSIRIKLMEDNGTANGGFASRYNSIASAEYNYDQYVSVSDVNGNGQDIILTSDGTCLSLPITTSFDYGAVYTVELTIEDTFYFEGKDQSIQKLTVEIEDDPSEDPTYNIADLKDNIVQLDLAKVSNEDVDTTSTFSFTYDGSVPNMSQGDIFLVKNAANADSLAITDFYGKFLSKEDLGDGKYKVYYQEPQGNEIYDDLHKKGVEDFNLEGNIEPLCEDEEFLNSMRYSSFTRGLLGFFSKVEKTKDKGVLTSLLDEIKVDVKFNYYNNKLTFSISLHVDKIRLGETNYYFSFAVKYTQAVKFTVDFDIGIKTKWFIPVGISYKIKMAEYKQESIEFDFIIDKIAETEPVDEDEIKNTLYDEIKNAKDGNDNFFKSLSNSAEAVKQTEGNTTTIPLFKLECPIYPPVVFDFKIDFIIDLSIQAMLVVKKQWESETVLFNFSNQKGGDGDTGQSITGTNCWDIYLMGTIELTLTLRFSGNLYIEGTYKFCHLSLYFDLYAKIGIQGVLMASFPSNTDGSDITGNISLDLYVQMGGRVGLEIVLAFIKKDFSIDIFKTYVLRIVFTNELQRYADEAEDKIVMNQTIMSIDETNVLNFMCWNGVAMRMENKKLPADSVTKLIESWFGDLEVRMFTFEVAEPDKMEISDDGVIHIKDGTAADFTTTFKIKMSNWAGFVSDKTITVEFHDPGAKHIYIDDVDMGRYRTGNTFTLPDPENRDGYKFLNYELNGADVDPGYVITVADEDIYVTTKWHKIIYYTVMFYDGFNHLVYVDSHVEEFTAVTPPSPEIRDQFMDGYFFIGWDKKIDYITSDLIVHGVYMKVGD